VSIVCVVAAAVAFVVLAWKHRAFTVDDAYITLRYSANLARGNGPTWNPSDPPTEGYTTFLWMLVATLPHVVGVDALVFAKVAGTLCAAGTALAAAALAREVARGVAAEIRIAAPVLAFVVVASSTSTSVHAISGMETSLYTLLVTAFFVALLAWVRRAREGEPQRIPLAASLLALGAALTRPEANLLAAAAAAAAVVLVPRSDRRRLVTTGLLAWALPYAVYFAWRYAYYGLLAPLSFYVKATNEPGFLRGTGELYGLFHLFFFAQPHLGIALVFALAARARAKAVVPMLAGIAAFLAFFLLPAPIMAYERRYLFPVIPALHALAAAGAVFGVERLAQLTARRWGAEGAPRRAQVVAAGVVLAFSLLAGVQIAKHAAGSIEGFTAYGEGLVRAQVQLGHDLRARATRKPPGTIALVDVGAVAYHSGWRVIDTFGLNDVHIARSRGAHDPAYVLAQDPEIVVFLSKEADRVSPHLPWEAAMHEQFAARGYVLLKSYRFAPDYFLVAYARPEEVSGAERTPPLP